MKIQYLGTAAAEGIPSLFCECAKCQYARKHGGKDIRTRSQAMLDDHLLIDYPPDSFSHFLKYKIDTSTLSSVIITHNHEDHWYPLDFSYFLKGFTDRSSNASFTVYGSEDIYPTIKEFLDSDRNQNLIFKELKPYQTYDIEGYQVTPLEAEHGTPHPYIYIISKGDKTLFYGNDNGRLKANAKKYILENQVHFDLVSLDCTHGDNFIPKEATYSHMCFDDNKDFKNWLAENKLVTDKTIFVLTHFSHNGGHVLYKDFKPMAEKAGFIVAYDGLEIDF